MTEATQIPMTYWQTVFMHVVVSAPALLIAYMAYRAASKAKTVGLETKAAVNEVHISINSRMDEYLRVTKMAGIEQGAKQEGEKRDAVTATFEAGKQSVK